MATGKNLFDPDKAELIDGVTRYGNGFYVADAFYHITMNFPWSEVLQPNTTYTIQRIYEPYYGLLSGRISMFNPTTGYTLTLISEGGGFDSNTFTTPADLSEFTEIIISGGGGGYFSDIQIEPGTTATDYEPYTTTEQYYPDVGVLRSVGDVHDEVVGGEHIKRIDDDGVTVLATPITTPIAVTGTLIGHPNGTVKWEPVLPVAGVYTAADRIVGPSSIDSIDRIVD